MLYRSIIVVALLFYNATFAEAQNSCRLSGISEEKCGTVPASGSSSVAGGRAAQREEIPWQAGVYTKRTQPFMQICGGSLVSARVVISAAHCFWNDLQKQLPAADFAVAVGKLYRPWNDEMDVNAQKSDIREIRIPPRYHGPTTNFQDDIALLIMATPFRINAYILPICLDFDYSVDRKHLTDGNMGQVSGWGRTDENGKASPNLQVVNIPSVDIERCYATIEPVFRPAITSDKICAGNNTAGTAVCMGDSGGGLVFPEITTDELRYYLRGVVSTAPRSVNENLCNIYTYATFTHVNKHEHFIREVITETSGSVPQGSAQAASVSTGIDLPSHVPSISETQSLPLPSTPDKPFYIAGLIATGKPKPFPKVTEDGTSLSILQPEPAQSVPDAEAEDTVKITEDPKPLSNGTEGYPSSGVVSLEMKQSDPNAEAEYTVKIIEEPLTIADQPSPLGTQPVSTEKGPYLSTASRPYLSTGKLPDQSGVFQPPQSSGNLPDQSGVFQPPQSSGNLPPQSSENLPDQSGVFQPAQSSGNLPDQSAVFQPPQCSENLPDQSSGNLPDQFAVFQPPQSSGNLPDQFAVFQPPQSSENLPDQSAVLKPPQSSGNLPNISEVFQEPQSSMNLPDQSAVFRPPQSSGNQPDISVFQTSQSSGNLPDQSGVFQTPQSLGNLPDLSGIFWSPQSSGNLPGQSAVFQPPQSSGNLPDQSAAIQPPQSLENLPDQSAVFQPPQSTENQQEQFKVYLPPQSLGKQAKQPSAAQPDPYKTSRPSVPIVQSTPLTYTTQTIPDFTKYQLQSPTFNYYHQFQKHHVYPHYNKHSHDHNYHQGHWDHHHQGHWDHHHQGHWDHHH